MTTLRTWAPIALGLAIGGGCYFGGMHAVSAVSRDINTETGQTAYVSFGTGGYGFVTPGQLRVYSLCKHGIWVGAAFAFFGASGFKKKSEPGDEPVTG